MCKTKTIDYLLIFITTMLLLFFISSPVLALEFSKNLSYQGSYALDEQKFDHTITLKIDYFQEITDDLFFQGDLIIRSSNKEYSKPFIIGPNELYISAYDVIENLDLKVGKIITRWGAADFFSPLGNFNPSPPELSLTGNQGKISAWGINATYYINSDTFLQAVLLPALEPSPYPDEYLADSYLAQFAPLYQKQGIDIDSVELSYLQTKGPIWGIQLSHTFPTFDAGISYYRGYHMDPFPAELGLSLNPSGNTMKMKLGYPAKQVFGLEFQGDFPGIEGATLRGDLAYIIPEVWEFQGEKLLNKPYIRAILSADYTTDKDLYLNGGIIYGVPFEAAGEETPYAYLNANKDFADSDLSPFYVGILSLKDMSMGNIFGIKYQINDDITASLSYLFVSGGIDSKMGILKPSEGFSFSLEWLF